MPRRKHNKPSPATPATTTNAPPAKRLKINNAALARPESGLGVRGICTFPFVLSQPRHSINQNIFTKIFEDTGNVLPSFAWDDQLQSFVYTSKLLTSDRQAQQLTPSQPNVSFAIYLSIQQYSQSRRKELKRWDNTNTDIHCLSGPFIQFIMQIQQIRDCECNGIRLNIAPQLLGHVVHIDATALGAAAAIQQYVGTRSLFLFPRRYTPEQRNAIEVISASFGTLTSRIETFLMLLKPCDAHQSQMFGCGIIQFQNTFDHGTSRQLKSPSKQSSTSPND